MADSICTGSLSWEDGKARITKWNIPAHSGTRREKKEKISLSTITKALIPTKMSNEQNDNTKTPKKFDYTAIADRLRTVIWSNYSHPTGVVNRFYLHMMNFVILTCYALQWQRHLNILQWNLIQSLKFFCVFYMQFLYRMVDQFFYEIKVSNIQPFELL